MVGRQNVYLRCPNIRAVMTPLLSCFFIAAHFI